MPCLLKPPVGRSKGILVFTHKERRFLHSSSAALLDAIELVRRRYVVGMHWGHFYDDMGDIPGVDFHLSGQGTVKFRPGTKAPRIPLCSRNFTKACFTVADGPKFWDIVNVSRPIRVKHLDQFLTVIRKIYDRGHSPRVLLVCPCAETMTEEDGWYTSLYDDVQKLFSAEERQRITLLMLNAQGYPFPLPSETIAHFYQASRVFTLFSDQEGESRVIAEALLCGLPVVVKRELRGGGRDYLDAGNSRQFDSLDEACSMFIELLSDEQARVFDPKPLEVELSERHSGPKLEAALRNVFAGLGVEFAGPIDLEDLGRKLPAHHITLPSSLRGGPTNDLGSDEAAISYLNELGGRQSLERAEQAPPRAPLMEGFGRTMRSQYRRLVRMATGHSG